MGLDFDHTTANHRPVGLTLVRASEVYGAEPFYHEVIAGIDRIVRPQGLSVLIRVLPTREQELETIERWVREQTVSAIILVDLVAQDERLSAVARAGVPAVVLGSPTVARGLPAVWTNDAETMDQAVQHLVALGHRRLAHVTGPSELAHTASRKEAFERAGGERDLTLQSIEGDYSLESGARAMSALLAGAEPPTAVVFDSDQMALGGLRATQEAGLAAPRDVSIVAWDDSAQCQLSEPALSALSHDVQRIGELAGESLLALLSGAPAADREAPRATLVRRATTGPVPQP
jgi:DNA-binding LacI/PurR family transcriptional regulator